MNLAPVAIGTYTRLTHLKRTVAALKNNTLASQSALYIFSDAPQPGDEQAVSALREYAEGISGFAEVTVIKRLQNSRIANNRGGIRQLMKEHGKVIFLEDDIVTAPGFLQFMNDALNEYEDNPNVLSVCGYTPSLPCTEHIKKDVFALPRFVGWGVGMWLNKFEKITKIPLKEYLSLRQDADKVERLNAEFGRDLLNRFKAEAYGHINGLDNRSSYLQMKTGMFSMHPKRSLVSNIGNDGSGLHASITKKFEVALWKKESGFVFEKSPGVSDEVRRQSVEFFSPNNEDMSPEIITNILNQIQNKNLQEIVLWGTDVLTTLFLSKLPRNIRVSCIVDSWAEHGDTFQEYQIMKPAEAYHQGHRIFVIMSFASRFKIEQAAHALGNDCVVVKYQ